MFKKLKELIQLQKDLSKKLDGMKDTVIFFSGIAELFANYIVFDLKSSPRMHDHPMKQDIIQKAYQYLSDRNIFWREGVPR